MIVELNVHTAELTTRFQERRLLGWSIDQWALVVAQRPQGLYPPTREGALALRKSWLTSDQPVDENKHDPEWALELFRNYSRHDDQDAAERFAAGLRY